MPHFSLRQKRKKPVRLSRAEEPAAPVDCVCQLLRPYKKETLFLRGPEAAVAIAGSPHFLWELNWSGSPTLAISNEASLLQFVSSSVNPKAWRRAQVAPLHPWTWRWRTWHFQAISSQQQ